MNWPPFACSKSPTTGGSSPIDFFWRPRRCHLLKSRARITQVAQTDSLACWLFGNQLSYLSRCRPLLPQPELPQVIGDYQLGLGQLLNVLWAPVRRVLLESESSGRYLEEAQVRSHHRNRSGGCDG